MLTVRETPASYPKPRLCDGLVMPNILHRPTRAAVGALALMVVGLCCLTLAKSSLWRQGIWTSWGSGRMTKGYAILYKCGWVGIGTGGLLLLLTWRLTVCLRTDLM